MKKFVVALVFAFAAVGAVSAQERNYTLTLSGTELGVIANALSERPYREVNPVITQIARQVQAQNAAAAEAAKQQSETPKDKPPAAPSETHEGKEP